MIIWASNVIPGGPYAGSMQPAYKPLYFIAEDDGSTGQPPVVYCDIYFNGIYYKTITATSPQSISGITTMWYFDISGICQEFMTTKIPDVTYRNLQTVYDDSLYFDGAAMVFCRFRNSQLTSGIITPGGIVPVQATVDSPAVSGDGYETDHFMVVNAALQKSDKISLEQQIKAFRESGSFFFSYTLNPGFRVYPLTYLKSSKIYINDYGQLPLICGDAAFLGAPSMDVRLVVFFAERNPSGIGGLYSLAAPTTTFFTMFENCIYYLPVGPQNWIDILPSLAATFTSPLVGYYRVGILQRVGLGLGFNLVYISPKFYQQVYDGSMPGIQPILPADVNPVLPTPTPQHTRLYFQNYLGHFDQLNFIERQETLKTISKAKEFTIQPYQGFKSDQQVSRNNSRSVDYSTVTGLFTEDQMPFVKQLLASSKTYLEFNNPIDVDDNTTRLMLPIVVIDSEITSIQFEDRFEYRTSIKYQLSSENIIVRR